MPQDQFQVQIDGDDTTVILSADSIIDAAKAAIATESRQVGERVKVLVRHTARAKTLHTITFQMTSGGWVRYRWDVAD